MSGGEWKGLGWGWWLLIAVAGILVVGVVLAAVRSADTLAPLSYPVH